MTTVKVLGYLLGPPVCASAALVLLVLALHAGRRDRSRSVFLLLLITLELWLVCTFLMRISPDVEAALFWDRLVGVWIVALFVTYFHFCYVCTGGSRRWPVAAAYVFLAAASTIVLPTSGAIERMTAAPYGYAPLAGPLAVPLFAASLAVVGAGIFVALRAYRRATEGEARNRFLYLGVAGFLPLAGAGLDAFSDLPPVAIWTNLAFSAVCMVAVLKYRLLHIRIVARAGVIRLIVSTLVAIPYVGALAILSMVAPEPVTWWLYAAGVLLFALLLRPLYGSVQELIDRLFYGERYDHLLALRNFSRETGSEAGLQNAGVRLTGLVRGALRASTAALLQPGPDSPELAARGETDGPRLRADGTIARWLEKHRAALSARAFATDPELRDLPEAERKLVQSNGRRPARARLRAAGKPDRRDRSGAQDDRTILHDRRSSPSRDRGDPGGHGARDRQAVRGSREIPPDPGSVAAERPRRGDDHQHRPAHPLREPGGPGALRGPPGAAFAAREARRHGARALSRYHLRPRVRDRVSAPGRPVGCKRAHLLPARHHRAQGARGGAVGVGAARAHHRPPRLHRGDGGRHRARDQQPADRGDRLQRPARHLAVERRGRASRRPDRRGGGTRRRDHAAAAHVRAAAEAASARR